MYVYTCMYNDIFKQLLLKAFHCYKPAERQIKCVPLFAALATHEVYYKDAEAETTEDADAEKPKVRLPSVKVC